MSICSVLTGLAIGALMVAPVEVILRLAARGSSRRLVGSVATAGLAVVALSVLGVREVLELTCGAGSSGMRGFSLGLVIVVWGFIAIRWRRMSRFAVGWRSR